MRGRMRRAAGRRLVRVGVLSVALLAVAGGIAYATIPAGNHVFTACFQRATGTMRLIDPSLPGHDLRSHCTVFEQEISWNQQGVQGQTGPTGATGPTGPQGVAGRRGTPGRPARPAARARRGRPATPGRPGDGPQGPTGAQGPQGPTGDTGPMGPAGQGAGEKVISGGTYGIPNADDTVPTYGGTGGFTITWNSPGNYTITMPPGTWACYPMVSFQAYFRSVTPTIQYGAPDGTVFTVDWGGENTTFNFIFIQPC